jgi:hypothetical protein
VFNVKEQKNRERLRIPKILQIYKISEQIMKFKYFIKTKTCDENFEFQNLMKNQL